MVNSLDKILIVDDEAAVRDTLREILDYEGYAVCEAQSGIEALEVVKHERIVLALIDVKMQGMDGFETMKHIRAEHDFPIIMISAHATIHNLVDTIKSGVYDFIPKPIDMNRLIISTRNAVEMYRLFRETQALKKQIRKNYELIGVSEKMFYVKDVVDRVAPTDARVMIVGANGVGKDLVARALHEKSQRAAAPFVEVNCAAIPNDLIESQLFGYEITGVTATTKIKKGDFELAHGGTLFIDEIADMSMEAQTKVLRAIREDRITRLGSDQDIPIDVRIIAATSKNLKEEVAAKRFREDLYHRLGVIVIRVPALSERVEDIPLFVKHFNEELSANAGKPPRTFTPRAIEALQKAEWPRNVRQLRNVVERLLILCDEVIDEEDVLKYSCQDDNIN